jgi:phosphatidylglycerophosphate synthase
MARVCVRPLIGTGVTPNHITTLRVATGLASCAAVALGTPSGALWGGVLWLASAFLDRADGELARIGDMKSRGGHLYDYYSDALINSLVFAGAGIGARHGWMGVWAAPTGVVAAVSMLVCWVVGEWYQQLEGSGEKAYAGRWGFDMDDGLYLIAPLIWFGLMSFVVLGAAVATSCMAILIIVRYRRLRARRGLAR